MMLQIGLTDSNLQRELGGIRNPTLDAFSEKIEGFEQAKRTMASSAHGMAVSQQLRGSFDSLSVSDNLVLLDSRRIVIPYPLSNTCCACYTLVTLA